jgi:hypothetical protein
MVSLYKGALVFSEQLVSVYFFLASHWSTFGQIRHSSGIGAFPGMECRNPEKCTHFAGESNTFGYSVALTPTIFMPSVAISSLDMQCGHA